MKILILVFLLIVKVISQSDVYDVPVDELDLTEYNNSVDSIIVNQLRELYERQINVPDGELTILCEIFPELYDILPLEKNLLDKYIPWDKEKIESFFDDYPVLKSFAPILRFDYNKIKSNGTLSFFVKRSYCDTTGRQWGRLRIGKEKCKFVGAFHGDMQDIKWERRLLYVKPENWLTIETGNLIPFEDKGMCYGFFPTYNYSSSFENWLYGGINSWNCLRITAGNQKSKSAIIPEFSYFLHKRSTERINGGKISFIDKKIFRASTATTRLLIDTGDLLQKELLYFHGNIKVSFKNFISDFNFCFEEKNRKCIPFSCFNVFKKKGIKTTIYILHIPSNFNAPRSFILNKYIDDFEKKGENLESLSIVSFSSSGKLFENLYITPAAKFFLSSFNFNSCDLQMSSQLKFRRIEDKFTITYRKYQLNNTNITIENIFSLNFNNIGIETGSRYYYSLTTDYNKTRINLAIFLNSSKYLQEQLFGKFIFEKEKIKEIILGIKHRVNLLDQTYSEVIFEREIINIYYYCGLRIRVNAILLF